MNFTAIRHGRAAGDRQRLRPVRRREVLHRLLYTIKLPGPQGDRLDHTVEFDLGRDDGRAVLYIDGWEKATTDMPGSFAVSGGMIEVSVGLHGVRRVHLVGNDGDERRLDPVRGTLEELRRRLQRRRPRLSRAIGLLAIAITSQSSTAAMGGPTVRSQTRYLAVDLTDEARKVQARQPVVESASRPT